MAVYKQPRHIYIFKHNNFRVIRHPHFLLPGKSNDWPLTVERDAYNALLPFQKFLKLLCKFLFTI
jgi:hypothetical protein